MKKDKKWLKEQIKHEEVDLKYAFDNYVPYEKVLIADDVNELLNQLEEPEQEKVVVPQFVADFITEIKPNFNIRTVFTLKNNKHEQGQEWALDNPDVFARAWLDGYTVEKEQLYYLKLPNNGYFGELTDEDYFERTIRKERAKKFTEQEIKAIDERYWAFAEEVTE